MSSILGQDLDSVFRYVYKYIQTGVLRTQHRKTQTQTAQQECGFLTRKGVCPGVSTWETAQ